MGELVATLRRFGELDVSDQLAGALVVMSPATMDRRLAPDRAAMTLRGRSHTKPGSLLKDAIAIRTWAQWDDAVPRNPSIAPTALAALDSRSSGGQPIRKRTG